MSTLPVNITDCAVEPIQFSGAIQPHGVLVSCVPGDWTVRHVSANVDTLLDVAPVAMRVSRRTRFPASRAWRKS